MSRSHIYEYGTVDVLAVYKEYPLDESTYNFELGGKSNKHGTVVAMRYHEPSGEGDAHYVDVEFDSGVVIRLFQPDEITFKRG